jgi:cytochrome c oxidase cbb3-type subunit 4
MSGSLHSTYELLRHFADSWGLLSMLVVFAVLCAWPFRPGARTHNETAASMIFEEGHDDGE